MVTNFLVEFILGLFFGVGIMTTYRVTEYIIAEVFLPAKFKGLKIDLVEAYTLAYFFVVFTAFLVIRLNIPKLLTYDNLQLLILVFFLYYSHHRGTYWYAAVTLVLTLLGELWLFGTEYWSWALAFYGSALFLTAGSYFSRKMRPFLRLLAALSGGVCLWFVKSWLGLINTDQLIYSLGLYLSLTLILFWGLVFDDNFRKTALSNEHNARFDEMTATKNYRSFVNEFAVGLKQAQEKKESFAFIMLDIDHFKLINDTYGHLAGNQVLKYVAGDLMQHVFVFDERAMVYRLGGEEFGIFLRNVSLEETQDFAQMCHDSLCKLVVPTDQGSLHLTASFGCDILRPEDNTTTLYRRVDSLLYQAKNGGRNQVMGPAGAVEAQ